MVSITVIRQCKPCRLFLFLLLVLAYETISRNVVVAAFLSTRVPFGPVVPVQPDREWREATWRLFVSDKKDKSTGSGKRKRKGGKRLTGSASKSKKKKKQQQQEKKRTMDEKKKVVAKAAAELLRKEAKTKNPNDSESGNLFGMLDPFQAGQKLRKTIGTALTSLGSPGVSSERRSIYYLDDRLTEQGGSGTLFTERNPLFDRLAGNDYVPEVLVVGATGEVGRLVVRRLLLDGRFRVRVLVRNLYSKTLNLLGTGVTYCQGDLSNIESLEYALTDVDKIVFCAGAPRPDETDFQNRFQEFVQENLEQERGTDSQETGLPKIATQRGDKISDSEWLELESVMEVRAKLAEQVDYIGMQNIVHAYQNVRVADYGTSQAAKRSLFKFRRPDDFNLFAIDDEEEEATDESQQEEVENMPESETRRREEKNAVASDYDSPYGDEDDAYYEGMDRKYDTEDDYYEEMKKYENHYAEYDSEYNEPASGGDEYATASLRAGASTAKAQCQWIQNEVGQGVLLGKVATASVGVAGEATVVSSRLRSREVPEAGIDLSAGFGGFICRMCADGRNYEAFVRTEAYEKDGVEYVCEFSTRNTSSPTRGRRPKNKFVTLRLDFDNFKPVQRAMKDARNEGSAVVPPFRGEDVRQLGFRFRCESNALSVKKNQRQISFYIALSYIKVYRTQPEPEFVYVSDARIPPVVKNGMVQHDARRVSSSLSQGGDSYQILNEAEMVRVAQNRNDRSGEETYYKYIGEEILKNSGLSYSIIRVAGYNEIPTADASSVQLQSSNSDVSPVSRADVAQVCVSALLDPNALNKSFYMKRSKSNTSSGIEIDDDLSGKFKEIPSDATQ